MSRSYPSGAAKRRKLKENEAAISKLPKITSFININTSSNEKFQSSENINETNIRFSENYHARVDDLTCTASSSSSVFNNIEENSNILSGLINTQSAIVKETNEFENISEDSPGKCSNSHCYFLNYYLNRVSFFLTGVSKFLDTHRQACNIIRMKYRSMRVIKHLMYTVS